MCWFDCCRLLLLVTLLGSTDRLVPTYRQHSLRLTAPTTGCYSYPAHYSLHTSPPTHAGQPDSGPGWLSRLPCQPPPWRYKSPVATARGPSPSSPPHHILPSNQPSRVRAHITISSTTTHSFSTHIHVHHDRHAPLRPRARALPPRRRRPRSARRPFLPRCGRHNLTDHQEGRRACRCRHNRASARQGRHEYG